MGVRYSPSFVYSILVRCNSNSLGRGGGGGGMGIPPPPPLSQWLLYLTPTTTLPFLLHPSLFLHSLHSLISSSPIADTLPPPPLPSLQPLPFPLKCTLICLLLLFSASCIRYLNFLSVLICLCKSLFFPA